ncbi:MAG: hypothetical protein AAF085_06015 [Planctomycetota bacterium]
MRLVIPDNAMVQRLLCRCEDRLGKVQAMASKTTTGFTLLLLVLVSLAGCQQYYNGAFGLGEDDYDAVNEYHLQREQRLIEQDQQQARLAAEGNATPSEQNSTLESQPNNTTEPVIYPDNADQPETQRTCGGRWMALSLPKSSLSFQPTQNSLATSLRRTPSTSSAAWARPTARRARWIRPARSAGSA